MKRAWFILAAVLWACSLPVRAWFGGKPPLDPVTTLRHEFAPYDLVKLNYLGINYCENLMDCRVNLPSYTHLGFDTNNSDAWHLHYPDDGARFAEALAFEDEYSPVVRLELVRRLMKGLIAARIPGTRASYFLRQRNGGRTFYIYDESHISGGNTPAAGRLLLTVVNDSYVGRVKVGCRAQFTDGWHDLSEFHYPDSSRRMGDPGTASSAPYFLKSPSRFERLYELNGKHIDFLGRYWLSDEDRPVEFGFHSTDAEKLEIVMGEPGKGHPLFADDNAPGIIHLPDRLTTFRSDVDGDRIIQAPPFHYLILRKATAWAAPGYSAALLVLWSGNPEQITALAKNGYGQIRVTYGREDGTAGGKVWLLPFPFVNDTDMEYVHRNAESFLSTGQLKLDGFPPVDFQNFVPAGLAAGAYLLAKYDDPFAHTAGIEAEHAVDADLEPELEGKKFVRVFCQVKAAAWMVRLGKLTGDARLVSKYMPWLEREVKRLLSGESAYDGNGWADGWTHANNTKAMWVAYKATGRTDYLEAYQKAAKLFEIDTAHVYFKGQPLKSPGGFETYGGVMPLALWGHDGHLDKVNQLLHLNVPNGWSNPEIPLKDLWNDTGAGPWAQDDATPEYAGFSLKGANIPQPRKYVLPMGAFPIYDATGAVTLTYQPMVDNPQFRTGHDRLHVLSYGPAEMERTHAVSEMSFHLGDARERRSRVSALRGTEGTFRSLVYKLNVAGSAGSSIDLDIKGEGYRVEISPDGIRWYERLDTHNREVTRWSLDSSFLNGSSDELQKMAVITPGQDTELLTGQNHSRLVDGNSRAMERDGAFTYRLNLPQVTHGILELILGNGCRVEVSADGKTWQEELNSTGARAGASQEDVAWIKVIDPDRYLNRTGLLYLRFSGVEDRAPYGGKDAFLRRLTVYGAFRTRTLYVRLTSTAGDSQEGFSLERLALRRWK